MKIFLLTQDENVGYDTYDSCVVVAVDEDDAKSFHPSGSEFIRTGVGYHCDWVRSKEHIKCKYLGVAHPEQKRGVVCSSFNAG